MAKRRRDTDFDKGPVKHTPADAAPAQESADFAEGPKAPAPGQTPGEELGKTVISTPKPADFGNIPNLSLDDAEPAAEILEAMPVEFEGELVAEEEVLLAAESTSDVIDAEIVEAEVVDEPQPASSVFAAEFPAGKEHSEESSTVQAEVLDEEPVFPAESVDSAVLVEPVDAEEEAEALEAQPVSDVFAAEFQQGESVDEDDVPMAAESADSSILPVEAASSQPLSDVFGGEFPDTDATGRAKESSGLSDIFSDQSSHAAKKQASSSGIFSDVVEHPAAEFVDEAALEEEAAIAAPASDVAEAASSAVIAAEVVDDLEEASPSPSAWDEEAPLAGEPVSAVAAAEVLDDLEDEEAPVADEAASAVAAADVVDDLEEASPAALDEEAPLAGEPASAVAAADDVYDLEEYSPAALDDEAPIDGEPASAVAAAEAVDDLEEASPSALDEEAPFDAESASAVAEADDVADSSPSALDDEIPIVSEPGSAAAAAEADVGEGEVDASEAASAVAEADDVTEAPAQDEEVAAAEHPASAVSAAGPGVEDALFGEAPVGGKPDTGIADVDASSLSGAESMADETRLPIDAPQGADSALFHDESTDETAGPGVESMDAALFTQDAQALESSSAVLSGEPVSGLAAAARIQDQVLSDSDTAAVDEASADVLDEEHPASAEPASAIAAVEEVAEDVLGEEESISVAAPSAIAAVEEVGEDVLGKEESISVEAPSAIAAVEEVAEDVMGEEESISVEAPSAIAAVEEVGEDVLGEEESISIEASSAVAAVEEVGEDVLGEEEPDSGVPASAIAAVQDEAGVLDDVEPTSGLAMEAGSSVLIAAESESAVVAAEPGSAIAEVEEAIDEDELVAAESASGVVEGEMGSAIAVAEDAIDEDELVAAESASGVVEGEMGSAIAVAEDAIDEDELVAAESASGVVEGEMGSAIAVAEDAIDEDEMVAAASASGVVEGEMGSAIAVAEDALDEDEMIAAESASGVVEGEMGSAIAVAEDAIDEDEFVAVESASGVAEAETGSAVAEAEEEEAIAEAEEAIAEADEEEVVAEADEELAEAEEEEAIAEAEEETIAAAEGDDEIVDVEEEVLAEAEEDVEKPAAKKAAKRAMPESFELEIELAEADIFEAEEEQPAAKKPAPRKPTVQKSATHAEEDLDLAPPARKGRGKPKQQAFAEADEDLAAPPPGKRLKTGHFLDDDLAVRKKRGKQLAHEIVEDAFVDEEVVAEEGFVHEEVIDEEIGADAMVSEAVDEELDKYGGEVLVTEALHGGGDLLVTEELYGDEELLVTEELHGGEMYGDDLLVTEAGEEFYDDGYHGQAPQPRGYDRPRPAAHMDAGYGGSGDQVLERRTKPKYGLCWLGGMLIGWLLLAGAAVGVWYFSPDLIHKAYVEIPASPNAEEKIDEFALPREQSRETADLLRKNKALDDKVDLKINPEELPNAVAKVIKNKQDLQAKLDALANALVEKKFLDDKDKLDIAAFEELLKDLTADKAALKQLNDALANAKFEKGVKGLRAAFAAKASSLAMLDKSLKNKQKELESKEDELAKKQNELVDTRKDRKNLEEVVAQAAQQLLKGRILNDAQTKDPEMRTEVLKGIETLIAKYESPLGKSLEHLAGSMSAMASGTADYLTKGLDNAGLLAKIKFFEAREEYLASPAEKLDIYLAMLTDRRVKDEDRLKTARRQAQFLLNPSADSNAEVRAKSHYLIALAFRNEGKFDEACKALDAAVAEAENMKAKGDLKKGKDLYEACALSKRDMTDAAAYYLPKVESLQEMGRLTDAKEEADVGLKAFGQLSAAGMAPKNYPRLLARRALVQLELLRAEQQRADGKFVPGWIPQDKANLIRADAEQAKSDAVAGPEAFYVLGMLDEENGDLKAAEDRYRDALREALGAKGSAEQVGRIRVALGRVLQRERTPAGQAVPQSRLDNHPQREESVPVNLADPPASAKPQAEEEGPYYHPLSALVTAAAIRQGPVFDDEMPEGEKKRIKESIEIAKELMASKDPKMQGRGQMMLGVALAKTGRRTEGLSTYIKGLKLVYPGKDMSDLVKMIEEHPIFQQPDATTRPNIPLAEYHYAQGRQLFFARKYPEAEAHFKQAVTFFDKDARYMYFFGLSQMAQNTRLKRDAADLSFIKAGKLEAQGNPSYVDVNISLERIQGEVRQFLNRYRMGGINTVN